MAPAAVAPAGIAPAAPMAPMQLPKPQPVLQLPTPGGVAPLAGAGGLAGAGATAFGGAAAPGATAPVAVDFSATGFGGGFGSAPGRSGPVVIKTASGAQARAAMQSMVAQAVAQGGDGGGGTPAAPPASKADDLTPEQRAAFNAEAFVLGSIPECEPPPEFCQ